MDLIIKNISSKSDANFFTKLAKRLGLKTAEINFDKLEDIALGKAIDKGMKSGSVTRNAIMKTLQKS